MCVFYFIGFKGVLLGFCLEMMIFVWGVDKS